jgi:purine-binding chemotaxis protein CheW
MGNTAVVQRSNGINNAAAKPGKYLSFRLADEEYGLEILKVQEIIGLMRITRVPTLPAFVRGVINLRGRVIPVVDLGLKFGMPAHEDTQRTCIIVVQVPCGNHRVTTGVLVDDVSEVVNITAEQIEPPPEFGSSINTEFLIGMGKVSQKVVMLLDVDKVFSVQEIAAVQKAPEQSAPAGAPATTA